MIVVDWIKRLFRRKPKETPALAVRSTTPGTLRITFKSKPKEGESDDENKVG